MSDGEVGGRAGVGSGGPTQHAGSCAATGASAPWVGPVRVGMDEDWGSPFPLIVQHGETGRERIIARCVSYEVADAIAAKLNAPAAGCGCRKLLLDEAIEQSSAGLDAGGVGNMVEFEVRERVVMVLRVLASRLPAPSEKQGGIADGAPGPIGLIIGASRADDVAEIVRLTAECERLREELATVTRERDELTGERDRMRAYIDGVNAALKGGAR